MQRGIAFIPSKCWDLYRNDNRVRIEYNGKRSVLEDEEKSAELDAKMRVYAVANLFVVCSVMFCF